MNPSLLDDIFIMRLEKLCEALKQESSTGFRKALEYEGEDSARMRVAMVSASQTKVEIRHRLQALIILARDIRRDLQGEMK